MELPSPGGPRYVADPMRRCAATSERSKTMTLGEWAALDEDVEGELVDGMLKEEEIPSSCTSSS